MFVNFNILNQLGSPAINSNTFANRPAAGQTGRLFVSTDTYEIYRDNGTSWDLIGGPGSSTITGTGTATQVAYFTSSQAIGSSANLFWDNTSGFLGVATATPTARIEAVKTDGIGIYANYTTNTGSGSSATAIWAKNVTNSSGFAAVIEETTPNTTAGQYPLLIKHSLSSGTAGVGMGTGVHWQLPDDAGTFKTTQLTIETINAAAATYATRYRFNVQSNGSSTPVAYINATGLGIFTATPGAALDIHSTGVIAQFNTTSGTGNTYVSFQRTGTGVWRIGDTYNSGANFFGLFNNSISTNAIAVLAATNKTEFTAVENYTTGLARGNYFDYNLNVPAGGSFSSPNAITALTATLDLTLAGSATIPSGARSGLDAYNSIAFTGAGTLTHNQGTQIRAYSNVTAGWAFNGSAVGTITHLAGLRALFPDNSGSAITITNNYALLLNDQTANTGTVTYTNRWGIYQEGASDLNYMAANLLLGSTTNNGNRLQITGSANATGAIIAGGGNAPTLGFQLPNTSGVNTPRLTNDASNATVLRTGASGSSIKFNNFANSSEMMLITDSGLLGLGISPSAKFDVQTTGQTLMRIEIPNVAQLNIGNGGNSINYYDANTQIFRTGTGTEVMRTTSTGLVGINTSTPNTFLQVNGTPDANWGQQTLFDNRTAAANQGGMITFSGYKTTTSAAAIFGQIVGRKENSTAGNEAGYLAFFTNNNTNYFERMRLDSSGNLGLNITPNASQGKLQISATPAATIDSALRITDNATISMIFNNTSTTVSSIWSSGNLGFGTGSNNYTERLLINSAGVPIFKGTGVSTNGRIEMYSDNAVTYALSIGFTNPSSGSVPDGSIQFATYGGTWNERARITLGGNFLIGTTTDAGQRLQVEGDAIFKNASNYNTVICNNGAAFGGGAFTVSQNGVPVGAIGVEGWWLGSTAKNLVVAAYEPNIRFYNNNTSTLKAEITSAGNLDIPQGSIKTAAPAGGTSRAWKLGARVGATVVLDTTQYLEVEVAGNFYKLAIVN